MEWSKENQARTSSEFMKKRWLEKRDEMIAICKSGGSVVGKVRQSPSMGTRKKISETLKRKGCHPPWELSPCFQSGYNRVELFGEETAERLRQAGIIANTNRIVSVESRLKMSRAKQGEKNINWKGGVTSKRQEGYNNWQTKQWRREVFRRDNHTCQDCRDTKYLNAHHIKEVSQYPELRFNVENGITLCLKCHKLTDNYGGKWAR